MSMGEHRKPRPSSYGRPGIKYKKVHIEDWEVYHDGLAWMLRFMAKEGNVRYVRHLSKLKLKLEDLGNGEHLFSEKQAFSLTLAKEEYYRYKRER